MRVLTVRQPWAWAIVHGGKTIENRTRNIAGAYRGPVAIHAAQREVPDKYAKGGPIDTIQHITGTVPLFHLPQNLGAVIGVVDLIDVHMECRYLEPTTRQCSPWAEPNAYHLEFANPHPITPIPAKGRLGLWTPDTALADQIRRALEENSA